MSVELTECPVVSLDMADMEEIRRLAEVRTDAQQSTDQYDDWDGSNPSTFSLERHNDMMEADLIGVAGEYAFAKYYDLPTPLSVDHRLPKGDGGTDYVVNITSEESGYTFPAAKVDVKCTDLEDGNLLHKQTRGGGVEADVYVLTVYRDEMNDVVLRGFTTSLVLCEASVVHDLPYPAKWVSRDKLHPLPPAHCIEANTETNRRETVAGRGD